MNLANSNFSHYTVFYPPVRGPYDANNRRKRQSAQDREFTSNFTNTTGTLMNLNGSVTYKIQVAAVATINGREITGDLSDATEMTTPVGGKQIYTYACLYINIISL